MLLVLRNIALWAVALNAGTAVSQFTSQQITEHFRGNLSKGVEIYFPSEPNWQTNTVQRWTVYPPSEPIYLAAIKPATEQDVSTIVRLAAHYNISYLATGGGHGLPITLGQLNDGISIDLSNFNDITLNEDARTVTAGGGSLFSELIDVVLNAGYEIVTGSCSCVGAVGATVGGGVSRLQGLHGLISDTVVSYKVVTAAGDIITASESQNTDLFWAMRGAGHNFGVVLEVTYNIYDATNNGKAFNADLIFPATANQTHWEILKNISANVPAELSVFSGINYNEKYGGINVLLNAVYYGPKEEGLSLIAPFLANDPLVTDIRYIDAIDVIPTSLFGRFNDPACRKNNRISTYTVGIKQIDIPTFDKMFNDMAAFYDQYPQTRPSTIYYETLPVQAVKQCSQWIGLAWI